MLLTHADWARQDSLSLNCRERRCPWVCPDRVHCVQQTSALPGPADLSRPSWTRVVEPCTRTLVMEAAEHGDVHRPGAGHRRRPRCRSAARAAGPDLRTRLRGRGKPTTPDQEPPQRTIARAISPGSTAGQFSMAPEGVVQSEDLERVFPDLPRDRGLFQAPHLMALVRYVRQDLR